MYLDNDKTFNEGQEGVVDPKDNRQDEIDYSNTDLDVELETEETYEEDSNNSVYEYGEEESEETYEEVEEEEEVIDTTPQTKNKQTKEENSLYARVRRKEEELAKREAAIREAEIERHIETDMLHPDKVWEYSEEHGISEDVARKILRLEAKQVANQMKLESEVRRAKNKEQLEELKKNSLYPRFEARLESLMASNPDVEAKVAFRYLIGENSEEVAQLLEKKVEKRTLANVQDNMRRRGIKGSDGAESIASKSLLSGDELDMTMAFGNNPKKIAQYVKTESKKLRR